MREEGGSLNCEKYMLWEGYRGNAVFFVGKGRNFLALVGFGLE